MSDLEIYNKGQLRYASQRGELRDGPIDERRKSLFSKGLLLQWIPKQNFIGSYFSVRTPTPEQFFAEYRDDGGRKGDDLLREYRAQLTNTADELGWNVIESDEGSSQIVFSRLLEADPTPPGNYDSTTIRHLLKQKTELDFVVPNKLTALRLFKHFITTYPDHSVAVCQSGRIEEFDHPVDVVISPNRNADRIRGTDGTHRRIVSEAERAAKENLRNTIEGNHPASAEPGWLTGVLRRVEIHDLGLTALRKGRHQQTLRRRFTRALALAVPMAALAVFVYAVGADVLLSQLRGATGDVILSLVPRPLLPQLSFRVPYWSIAIVIALGALVTLGTAYVVGFRDRTGSSRVAGGTTGRYDSNIVEELKEAVAEMRRSQFVDAVEILTGLNESEYDRETMVVKQGTLDRNRSLWFAFGVVFGLALGGAVGYGLALLLPIVFDNWLLATNVLWVASLIVPVGLVGLLVLEGAATALRKVGSAAASGRTSGRGRRGRASNTSNLGNRNRSGGRLRLVIFTAIALILAAGFGFMVFYVFGDVIRGFLPGVI